MALCTPLYHPVHGAPATTEPPWVVTHLGMFAALTSGEMIGQEVESSPDAVSSMVQVALVCGCLSVILGPTPGLASPEASVNSWVARRVATAALVRHGLAMCDTPELHAPKKSATEKVRGQKGKLNGAGKANLTSAVKCSFNALERHLITTPPSTREVGSADTPRYSPRQIEKDAIPSLAQIECTWDTR